MPTRTQVYRLLLICEALLIFALVPVGRKIQYALGQIPGPLALLIGALGSLAVVSFFILHFYSLFKRQPTRVAFTHVGIIAFLLAACYRSLLLPIEIAHLFEYGLLGFFAFSALASSTAPTPYKVRKLIIFTLLAVIVVGALDEILQGLHPQRFFDWRDIWINLCAGSMGLVLALGRINDEGNKRLAKSISKDYAGEAGSSI